MSHRRAGAVLASFTLTLCVLVGGCQSTSSMGSILTRHNASAPDIKSAVAAPTLAPGMEVEWHVKTVHSTPNQINSGRSVVGPDGAVELGPYGSCLVAGMPLAQASAALEKHLAQYLHRPAVTITPLSAAQEQIAWRPAATPASSAFGNSGAISPVAFQTTAPSGEKSSVELIPAPRQIALMPAPTGAPPVVAFSAPNECRPALLPPYVIGPTDVLIVDSLIGLLTQPVRGPHIVGPDGTVRLGVYGSAVVAGLTLDQAKAAVAQAILPRLRQAEDDNKGRKKEEEKDFLFTGVTLEQVTKGVSVSVLAYNSKQFWVITDGGGQGDPVITLPVTGNDFVLNALSKIGGVNLIGSKHHIWVARQTCPGCPETKLPVDWIGITKRGEGATNWQIMPNDRIYIQADTFYAADRHLGKWLAPIERLFGAALLGSQTVNSIGSGSVGGTR